MKITPQMIEFIQKRRSTPRAELYEEFLDSFYLDGTDADENLFAQAFEQSRNLPQKRAGASRHSDKGGMRTRKLKERKYSQVVQGQSGPDLERAPYRFVPLNERILDPESIILEAIERNSLLDQPIGDGLSGHLNVDWVFETPMLIGNKTDENAADTPTILGDKPVIPGSTIRGLLRATAEIAGFAKLTQANLHHRYGLRDFTHPQHVKDESNRNAIAAGWLQWSPVKEDKSITDDERETYSDFTITPCARHELRISNLPGAQNADPAEFRLDWLQKPMVERYRSIGMASGPLFDFYKSRTFAKSADGELVEQANGSIEGVVVVSDRSPTVVIKSKADEARWLEKLREEDAGDGPGKGEQKKREHVFQDIPGMEPIRLKKKEWDLFELINSKPARNKRAPTGNWETLRKSLRIEKAVQDVRARIPVFFVGALDRTDDERERFEFGLVRMFKRAHTNSVKDAIPAQHHVTTDNFKPDFVEALFGYVHEDLSQDIVGVASAQLGGRVATGFASCTTSKENWHYDEETTAVMSGPRASFAPFYLRGREKDWSSEVVRVAGRKRYPARHPGQASVQDIAKELEDIQATDRNRRSREIQSRMKFLTACNGAKLRFNGPLRFHNVTKAELGLVLWCLLLDTSPNPKFRHLIGRARNAGAGQARVERIEGQLTTATGETKVISWDRGSDLGPISDLIDHFAKHVSSVAPAWPAVEEVENLQLLSDPSVWVSPRKQGKLKYLALRDHMKLKNMVKAHFSQSPPDDIPLDHAALPAREHGRSR